MHSMKESVVMREMCDAESQYKIGMACKTHFGVMFAGKFFCICCICMLPDFIDSGERFFWCLNSSCLPRSSHQPDSKAATKT